MTIITPIQVEVKQHRRHIFDFNNKSYDLLEVKSDWYTSPLNNQVYRRVHLLRDEDVGKLTFYSGPIQRNDVGAYLVSESFHPYERVTTEHVIRPMSGKAYRKIAKWCDQ